MRFRHIRVKHTICKLQIVDYLELIFLYNVAYVVIIKPVILSIQSTNILLSAK